jgi:hypothetical protein
MVCRDVALLRLYNARTVENKTISFDGKFVEPKEVGLPPVLK